MTTHWRDKEAAVSTLDRLAKEYKLASPELAAVLEMARDAMRYPLRAFIKDEVPFRLEEILGVSAEDETQELVDDLIEDLDSHSDIMFNYDAIDDRLREQLDERGVKYGEADDDD